MSLSISAKSLDQATNFVVTRDEDEVSITVIGIAEFELTLDLGSASGQPKAIRRSGVLNESVSIVNKENVGRSNSGHATTSGMFNSEAESRYYTSGNAVNEGPVPSTVPNPVGGSHLATSAKSPAPTQPLQRSTTASSNGTQLGQLTTNVEGPIAATIHQPQDKLTRESVSTAPLKPIVVEGKESTSIAVPTDATNKPGDPFTLTSETDIAGTTDLVPTCSQTKTIQQCRPPLIFGTESVKNNGTSGGYTNASSVFKTEDGKHSSGKRAKEEPTPSSVPIPAGGAHQAILTKSTAPLPQYSLFQSHTSQSHVPTSTPQQTWSANSGHVPYGITSLYDQSGVQASARNSITNNTTPTNQPNSSVPLFPGAYTGPSFPGFSTSKPLSAPAPSLSPWTIYSTSQQGTTPTTRGLSSYGNVTMPQACTVAFTKPGNLPGPVMPQNVDPFGVKSRDDSTHPDQSLRPWTGTTGFSTAPNPAIPPERPFVPEVFQNAFGPAEIMESISTTNPYTGFSHEELRENYYKTHKVGTTNPPSTTVNN